MVAIFVLLQMYSVVGINYTRFMEIQVNFKGRPYTKIVHSTFFAAT